MQEKNTYPYKVKGYTIYYKENETDEIKEMFHLTKYAMRSHELKKLVDKDYLFIGYERVTIQIFFTEEEILEKIND